MYVAVAAVLSRCAHVPCSSQSICDAVIQCIFMHWCTVACKVYCHVISMCIHNSLRRLTESTNFPANAHAHGDFALPAFRRNIYLLLTSPLRAPGPVSPWAVSSCSEPLKKHRYLTVVGSDRHSSLDYLGMWRVPPWWENHLAIMTLLVFSV